MEYLKEYGNQFQGPCYANIFYKIFDKQILSADSIIYSVQVIMNYNGQGCGSGSMTDTFQSQITNNTVYKNQNNLLGFFLHEPIFDTTILMPPFDSTYVVYDTTIGLKRLKAKYNTGLYGFGYLAIQDIGVISFGEASEDQSFGFYNYNLQYAHLSHYGIYGTYVPVIYSGINESENQGENFNLYYDNDLTPYLSISSNKNIFQFTVSIFDCLGRKIKSFQAMNGNNLFAMNNFSGGIYFYKVESENKIFWEGKFINCK